MGPRRYRRGNFAAASRAAISTPPLQWGHDVTVAEISTRQTRTSCSSCFNGATTLPSRKSAARSWVSVIFILLQWGHDVTVAEIRRARTRPRKTQKLQWGHDVTVAEIRRARTRPRKTQKLQWGHDVTVAEMSRSSIRSSIASLLQWGHDVTVAEIVEHVEHVEHVEQLQWGHCYRRSKTDPPEVDSAGLNLTHLGFGFASGQVDSRPLTLA